MRKVLHLMLIAAAVVCFLVSGNIGRRLAEFRVTNRMGALGVIRNAPPLVSFTTVVLGGFRGLLADMLWLRTSSLQEEGRYFELVQLADWITKLEPRFTEVWAYHAWNMGYNVSVMMPDPADRWRWVNNGIQLLRDEALLYNPGDPALYFELASFFQFKLGESTDMMHLYYKKEWAREMTRLLGGGQPDYAKLTAESIETMRGKWKLQPESMEEIDKLYGPLDWRLPHTHAVYWGYLGMQAAKDQKTMKCDRVVFQSLAALFRKGRLTYDPDRDIYTTQPEPAIVPGAIKAYEDAMAKFHSNETVCVSYSNFLKEAVITLYDMGKPDESRKAFDRMMKVFPSPEISAGLDAFVKDHRADFRR